ncbi:MAG TPA: hypothetical protein VEH31_09335 [Streptosporangiaceae bacterium]|nr:hypothetical protein [Streptosporangiaceae bacterium]
MSQTHAAARAAGRTQPERLVRLRGASIGVVVMLIIQFILGMIYNLYGTAPTSTKSIGLFSSPTIALHVIVGIVLGLAAIAQLVRAIGARHSLTIWLSALGLVFIIGAGFAGLGFSGSGAAGASLGMSLAFAAALACYLVLIVVLPSAAAAAEGSRPSSTT